MNSPRPCRKCKEDFEISDAALKKGNYICKDCRRLESAENLKSRKGRGLKISGSRMPIEYHREYGKTYYARPEVKKRRLEQFYNRMECPEERLKYEARKELRNAVRRGEVEKKDCEVCGSKKSQAHHDDYGKPLDVRWLCALHHAEHHAKARGEQP